jgi:hypothetical protein
MCRYWTQRIRSLMNFITYLEPPYVLNYNYIVVPLPIGFFVSAHLNGEGVQKFLTFVLTPKVLQLCTNRFLWVVCSDALPSP